MAVRLNGNTANYLSRSSDLLDYNNPYTLMAWVRPETVSGADNIFVLSHLTSTAYDSLSMSGGVLSIAAGNGSFPAGTSGSTLSAGTYRHVALVRVGTSDLRLYLDGVLDATHTTSVSGRTALNRMLLGIWSSGGFGASDPYDGRYAYAKAWNVALSAGEIQQEMAAVLPRRLLDLYAFWPMREGASERVKDYSGNGRDWTANGTVSDEDPPPISWGGRIGRRVRAAATTYNQAVAGTLTSSGALTRRTTKLLAGTLTSAGALAKRTTKLLAGTLSSSGTLSAVRVFLKSIGGTLTSAGALTRRTTKMLAGTLTSAGALVRRTTKLLAGTLSSSGTLSAVRVFLKAIGGTLTSAGVLTRRTTKLLAGTLTSAGTLTRQITKLLAGTLTSAGVLTRRTTKLLAGTLTSAGAVAVARLLAWLRHIFGVVAVDRTSTATLNNVLMVASQDRTSTAALNNVLAPGRIDRSSSA